MGLTAAIGAGLGLAGSLVQGSATRSAARTAADAAQFRPYSTSNIFGGASWNPATQSVTQSLSPWAQGVAGQLQGQATAGLSGPWGPQGNMFMQGAAGDVGGAYSAAQNVGMPSQRFLQGIVGGMGQIPGMIGNYGDMSGMFPMNAPQSVDFGNFNPNLGAAQQQMGIGQGLMSHSYGDVAQQRLGLLRDQAAPFEQRATDSLMQRLFSQGRMGSTGGGRDIEAFARGLGQADTSRQLDAQGFAEQLYGRDQSLGANLFSAGVGNFMQGDQFGGQLGLQRNIQQMNQNQASAGFGLDANRLGLFGQQLGLTADTTRAGLSAEALGNIYNTTMGFNELQMNRADQRLARAQQLFGFGETLGNTGNRQASNAMGLLSGLTAEQQQLLSVGLNAGGAQATAGANAGRFMMAGAENPFAGFLQGLGGGLLTSAPSARMTPAVNSTAGAQFRSGLTQQAFTGMPRIAPLEF